MPINKKIYPDDWPKIRQRILHRAGYQCERCGIDRYTVYHIVKGDRIPILIGETYSEANALRKRISAVMGKKVKVIRLTTAHLNHDEWNQEVKDEDLACLCEKCHFAHDQIDNQLRKKNGKHYQRYQLEMPFCPTSPHGVGVS